MISVSWAANQHISKKKVCFEYLICNWKHKKIYFSFKIWKCTVQSLVDYCSFYIAVSKKLTFFSFTNSNTHKPLWFVLLSRVEHATLTSAVEKMFLGHWELACAARSCWECSLCQDQNIGHRSSQRVSTKKHLKHAVRATYLILFVLYWRASNPVRDIHSIWTTWPKAMDTDPLRLSLTGRNLRWTSG